MGKRQHKRRSRRSRRERKTPTRREIGKSRVLALLRRAKASAHGPRADEPENHRKTTPRAQRLLQRPKRFYIRARLDQNQPVEIDPESMQPVTMQGAKIE